MKKLWVLLDFDGNPIRYYDYPAQNAVEIKEEKLTLEQIFELVGECLL